MTSDTIQLWLVKSILHCGIEWKNRLHTNGSGLLHSTRGLTNSWLSYEDVQREGEAHWKRGEMKRSRIQQWKNNVKYGRGDAMAFSMEEQQCCTLHRKSSVSVWVVGRGEFLWGSRSHSYLCWGRRIPLLHLSILGEKCLLRTSITKTAGGLL